MQITFDVPEDMTQTIDPKRISQGLSRYFKDICFELELRMSRTDAERTSKSDLLNL